MYAELNESKTEIVKRYGPGRNPKHTSFSENSSHEDYTAHGYYLIIDEVPDIPNTKRFGDRTFTVDEAAKTVDISREVVNKTPEEIAADARKPVDIENLVDLLESKGIITTSEAATLRT